MKAGPRANRDCDPLVYEPVREVSVEFEEADTREPFGSNLPEASHILN